MLGRSMESKRQQVLTHTGACASVIKKKHVTNSYYIIHTNKHSLWIQLPSGDPTVRYGKSPCLIGKSTIAMAMFNSKLYDLKPFSSAGSNIIQHPTIAGPRKVFGGSEDFHKKNVLFGVGSTCIQHAHAYYVYIYIYLCIYIYIYRYVCFWCMYIYIYKQFNISNSWFKDIKNKISSTVIWSRFRCLQLKP